MNGPFAQLALVQVLFFAVLGEVPATAATWNKAAGGTYDWNDTANWTSGTLPTATTDALLNNSSYRPAGAQTITGDGDASYLDIHNTQHLRKRVFTGNLNLGYFDLRIGAVNLTGTWNVTGTPSRAYCRIGTSASTSYGLLDIGDGGHLFADGPVGVYVGKNDTADNSASGRLRVREGGKLTIAPDNGDVSTAGILLGRTTVNSTTSSKSPFVSSSYVQDGGEARIGRLVLGFETNSVGSIVINGGSFDLAFNRNKSSNTRYRVGYRGYAHFQLLGGDVYALTNASPTLGDSLYNSRPYSFEIGSGLSPANGLRGAYFYANGGAFTTAADFSIGGQSNNQAEPDLHATIDGVACVTARVVRVGGNTGGGRASLNLNGGTLVPGYIFANPNRSGTSEINANGGTIHFTSSAGQYQGLFLDAINIYECGLVIRCDTRIDIGNAGTNVLLKTPTGYGIDSITISNSGKDTVANCYNPPWISLSGGNGTGASAIGLVNWEDNADTLTNIVVACRGEGYAAADTPTANVIRWDNNNKTLSGVTVVNLSTNLPGTLVKTGASDMAIYAQPDFAGTYEVRGGKFIQSFAASVGSPNVAAIVVGGAPVAVSGSETKLATFQTGTGNSTAPVQAKWNAVNPLAKVTLGTSNGPGKLTVPGAATGEASPFEQSFASLTVNGIGNIIDFADGSYTNIGTKLSFGTISCAEGSSLTIPAADSTFKVYVPASLAGRSYPCIHFADRPDRNATVANDGQLVPQPAPFVMVVR